VRGGKPEMFFASLLSISFEDVLSFWQRATDSWESEQLISIPFSSFVEETITDRNRNQFEEIVTKMFEQYKLSMSLQLLTNLALWIKLKRAGELVSHTQLAN